MTRLRYTDVIGVLGSGGLTNVATTHTFTSLTYANGTAVPTLSGTDYFLLSILDASGNVLEVIKVTAYNSGTKAATIARAQEGTTAIAHAGSLNVALSAYPSDFGGVSSGIIGYKNYAPSGGSTPSNSTTTSADADATNMVVTFIAPPSGNVVVTLSCTAYLTAATSEHWWGLRDASGDVANSYGMVICSYASATIPNAAAYTARRVMTGLTPGTSYTWKWALKRVNGSGSAQILVGSSTDATTAPAVMVVEALP